MKEMSDLFLNILNRSIAASWLILAVVLLRFVLKKTPRWMIVLLWGIVALRLAVPFSFESAMSLLPTIGTIHTQNIQPETPAQNNDIPTVNHAAAPVPDKTLEPNPNSHVLSLYSFFSFVSVLWLIGIAVLLLYAVISSVRIHQRVAERMPYKENIFLCDQVMSPFILGFAHPKIYLPSNLNAALIEPVIRHEKAHLARHDHWWKPAAFLILTAHWFNPLCWIAYVLLCRDMELACDEKVIRQMNLTEKKQYSTALLECSVRQRLVTIYPLTFGEIGIKERVKNVLHYKKPAFWGMVVAAFACVVVTICFATNPVSVKNYIRLQSTHSTPPAAFFALHIEENLQGTVLAERWENGKCISTNPVFMNNLTQQIQLYLDPQEQGVNVQLGTDNGETIVETFSYPEGKKPAGWSFVSLKEGEKTSFDLGTDHIIAAMVFDFGNGLESYSCDSLTNDKKQVEQAAYMIVIRTSFGTDSDFSDLEEESDIRYAERPTLIIDGITYVDPYMPVSSLPYGYQSAGTLTDEQANNTDLAGIEYFVSPSGTEDFYTYQECGTPVDLNTVDPTKRQWAYVRWIQADNDGVENRKLTLDDVVMLSQKGNALSWSDFERYSGQDIGSGLIIMRYEIDELFEVLVGGSSAKKPMYIYLRVNNEAEDFIDIREENVSTFLEQHKNDVPKTVESKQEA